MKTFLQNQDANARQKLPVTLVVLRSSYKGVYTNAKNKRSKSFRNLHPCNRTLPGLVFLDSCTPWEAGPIFALLILAGICLDDGERIAGLLLLSVHSYHPGTVVIVCSIAGAPRSLDQGHQLGTGPRHHGSFLKTVGDGNRVLTYRSET